MNKDFHLWNSRTKSMETPKHSHIVPFNKDMLVSCVLLDDMSTLGSHDTSTPTCVIIGSCIDFKHNTSHYLAMKLHGVRKKFTPNGHLWPFENNSMTHNMFGNYQCFPRQFWGCVLTITISHSNKHFLFLFIIPTTNTLKLSFQELGQQHDFYHDGR